MNTCNRRRFVVQKAQFRTVVKHWLIFCDGLVIRYHAQCSQQCAKTVSLIQNSKRQNFLSPFWHYCCVLSKGIFNLIPSFPFIKWQYINIANAVGCFYRCSSIKIKKIIYSNILQALMKQPPKCGIYSRSGYVLHQFWV